MQKSALVIDDSRVARMTLVKHLKSHGFAITQLGSGEEALDWLSADDHRPDIIFMDVMMEGMDGLTATRKIKADSKIQSIPVVICSGNDAQDEMDAALGTGAQAVLSKPPQQEQVDRILNEVEAIVASTPEPSPQPVQPKVVEQVIKVDEAAILQKLISEFESQYLPKINQNIRNTVEDISNQVAADIAEKLIKEKGEQLQGSMQSFVKDTTEQSIAELSTQLESSSIKTVSLQARGVLEQKFGELNITDMFKPYIETQIEHISVGLEDELSQRVEDKLGKSIQSKIDTFMDDELPQRVDSLLRDTLQALKDQEEPEVNHDQETEDAALKLEQQLQAMKKQNSLAMMVSLVSVVTAVGVLAYSLLT
jgi:CheY-like chemotaxis protein